MHRFTILLYMQRNARAFTSKQYTPEPAMVIRDPAGREIVILNMLVPACTYRGVANQRRFAIQPLSSGSDRKLPIFL
jgi:hypothetical protein